MQHDGSRGDYRAGRDAPLCLRHTTATALARDAINISKVRDAGAHLTLDGDSAVLTCLADRRARQRRPERRMPETELTPYDYGR
jgi:hypothetical protein